MMLTVDIGYQMHMTAALMNFEDMAERERKNSQVYTDVCVHVYHNLPILPINMTKIIVRILLCQSRTKTMVYCFVVTR